MDLLRKIGISLIVIFSVFVALIIVIFEPKENIGFGLFILLVVGGGSMIPLGTSMISINSPSNRRNKIKRIYLYISLFLIVTGIFLRIMKWPLGGVLVSGGCLWYCFAFAPLELKHKYLKWLPYSKNRPEVILLSLIDFIGLNAIALGALFKFQHYAGQNALLIAGASVLLVGMFFWNYKFKREVITRKVSEDTIREQYLKIQDSIVYAKRIQSAILPPLKLVKEYLKESFILYKPKDIIAGDFYWMEQKVDLMLFAVADCTGHGVPGALVSVVCSNGLNRSVREFGLTDPGLILDKTREIVLQEFEKSEEEVKDGMDIALCSFNGSKLQYAGAYNPLWIIRRDSEEIEEIKANRQPIGNYDEPRPFTTHVVDLNKGDTIYLFSDGIVDQFGGVNRKKFKVPNFKKLLLSIQDKSMEHQKQTVDDTIENWRGESEQIDDICLIGMRI